jgi:hypothetical protein
MKLKTLIRKQLDEHLAITQNDYEGNSIATFKNTTKTLYSLLKLINFSPQMKIHRFIQICIKNVLNINTFL